MLHFPGYPEYFMSPLLRLAGAAHLLRPRLILAGSRYALIALTAKIGARLVATPPALRLATRFMKYPGYGRGQERNQKRSQ